MHPGLLSTLRRQAGLRAAALAACLACAVLTARPGHAAPADTDLEYRIKAAYLYNFTKFIDWPPRAFPDPKAPFTIGILGTDPAATHAIDETLRGKTTHTGRPIVVRVFRTAGSAAASGAQLLFVLHDARVSAAEVGRTIGTRPVLVVGERAGFAEHGGTINFVVSGDAVQFEINPRRAAIAGLHVSGVVASVARLVHDPGDWP